MGFMRERHGRVTIEARRESFIIHPGYGYDESGNELTQLVPVNGGLEVREEFAHRWRTREHPEFTYDSLDDLIDALTHLRNDLIADSEVVRVDADAVCPNCSQKYGAHRSIPGWPSFYRGCGGILLKL